MVEKASSQSQDIHRLKSLTLCDQKRHHKSCILASNLMSPRSSPHMGDYIGMESCVDMRRCEDVQMTSTSATSRTEDCYTTMMTKKKKMTEKRRCAREIPPPISLLARTENLPWHMPFVLRRHYTSDGRLILREERVRHHEYLRAHRSNGHLTLQLVLLDYDDEDDECDDDDVFFHLQIDDENENGKEEVESKNEEEVDVGIEELRIAQQILESSSSSEVNENSIGGMCLNYNNVIMSSSCYLGVPVPAIKPVRT